MLETLLHIGRKLRLNKEDAKRFRHLAYIVPAPIKPKKKPIVYYSIPFKDGNFIFDPPVKIEDDYEQEKLFFLNFKTSGSDSWKKYLFGDILYGEFRKPDGKIDFGSSNYRLGSESGRKTSFQVAEDDAKDVIQAINDNLIKDSAETNSHKNILEEFRQSFEKTISEIEALLREKGRGQYVFLHFDFDGKHWYEFDREMAAINDKVLAESLNKQNDLFALSKFYHPALIGAISHTPEFSEKNRYKNKAFKNTGEVLDLMYALKFLKKPKITVGDIKIVVLPRGRHLEATHIEDFFKAEKELEKSPSVEKDVVKSNKPAKNKNTIDSFFGNVLNDAAQEITQFDFIFSKSGGNHDVDMIELSGIERSSLTELAERVREISIDLKRKREGYFIPKDLKGEFETFEIKDAFKRIFGKLKSGMYQSHLLKVLPRIYSWNYYRDDILLPMFLETVEYQTRNRKAGGADVFNLLKFDYEFLVRLRNTKGDNTVKEMKERKSYKAGRLLGEIAKPLKEAMGAFEKNIVGQLRRRITDSSKLLDLSNTIREKLAMHNLYDEKHLYTRSAQFAETFGDMSEQEYDRNEFAYGFFDGYFSFSKRQKTENDGQTATANEQVSENPNRSDEESLNDGNEQ